MTGHAEMQLDRQADRLGQVVERWIQERGIEVREDDFSPGFNLVITIQSLRQTAARISALTRQGKHPGLALALVRWARWQVNGSVRDSLSAIEEEKAPALDQQITELGRVLDAFEGELSSKYDEDDSLFSMQCHACNAQAGWFSLDDKMVRYQGHITRTELCLGADRAYEVIEAASTHQVRGAVGWQLRVRSRLRADLPARTHASRLPLFFSHLGPRGGRAIKAKTASCHPPASSGQSRSVSLDGSAPTFVRGASATRRSNP